MTMNIKKTSGRRNHIYKIGFKTIVCTTIAFFLLFSNTAFALFDSKPKPHIKSIKTAEKIDVTYDLITIENEKTDYKIEENKGYLKLVTKAGETFDIKIPEGELNLICEHHGAKYAKKLCDKLEDLSDKEIQLIFKKIVIIRDRFLKSMKSCNSECFVREFGRLGRDYKLYKKEALNKLKNHLEHTVKIDASDAASWNEKWDDLRKARDGVRWTIAWESVKSTFEIGSSVGKIAATGGLAIASYATVVKDSLKLINTLKNGYGSIKNHIESLNTSLGSLRYAMSVDKMTTDIQQVESALNYIKAATRRDMRNVLQDYLNNHLKSLETIEQADLIEVEEEVSKNRLSDIKEDLIRLRKRKKDKDEEITQANGKDFRKKLKKELVDIEEDIKSLEKEQKELAKGTSDPEKKKKLAEIRVNLLAQLKNVTLLVNDLLVDPVGIPIREVLEGSESIKGLADKNPMKKLDAFKTSDDIYQKWKKNNEETAGTLKKLKMEGSIPFKDPKTGADFVGTDEIFILVHGAENYLKQKKSYLKELERQQSTAESTWRVVKQASDYADNVIKVLSDLEGAFINITEAVTTPESGPSHKDPVMATYEKVNIELGSLIDIFR
jgi:hypothetical protein